MPGDLSRPPPDHVVGNSLVIIWWGRRECHSRLIILLTTLGVEFLTHVSCDEGRGEEWVVVTDAETRECETLA